jgi:kelch-like protein 18
VPYTAAGMFATSDGTSVYAGGGFDEFGNIHNDLVRYDPMGTFCWTSLATSPDQHYASQAIFFKGKIYNIGGLDPANNPTNTTRIYDISTNSWTTGAPMPSALSDMATVLWDGIVYIAGGYDGADDVNTLHAYDIAADAGATSGYTVMTEKLG